MKREGHRSDFRSEYYLPEKTQDITFSITVSYQQVSSRLSAAFNRRRCRRSYAKHNRQIYENIAQIQQTNVKNEAVLNNKQVDSFKTFEAQNRDLRARKFCELLHEN